MKSNTQTKALSLLLFLGLTTSAMTPMTAYAAPEGGEAGATYAGEEATEEGGEQGGEAGATYAGEEAT